MIEFLRAQGNRILSYLDDIIIVSHSKEQFLLQLGQIMKWWSELWFTVNFEKSSLVPSHELLQLGCMWDSYILALGLPDEKVALTWCSTVLATIFECSIDTGNVLSRVSRKSRQGIYLALPCCILEAFSSWSVMLLKGIGNGITICSGQRDA